ncbi:hypothetical protein BKH42_08330 [Helicobacter sp. 13S00482-2]|uniref:divergent polysaccharide deacetylase family protein n=1 Tax=Helicobacter sp. 13S00482-2 TaxID=1476200 RepID=UPI000BA54AF2|nr:divergent polysaccharide deacetylase family protein [Helicobacter sp. 13S00482-2]PAF52988.1 hypothetical protein BKH42_08330 [Helicobacter sp. 13S00482-2]
MKKRLILSLLCVSFILGCFSGYWVYKNSSSYSSPTQDNLKVIPDKNSNFLLDRGVHSWSDQTSWENFSTNSKSFMSPSSSGDATMVPEKPKSILKTDDIKKPKIAIIMDDMAYPWQLQSLHNLGLRITPSFFPYNSDNKLTPKMAAKEPFYMVHVPMEALNFYQSPHKWIKVGETKSQIEEYIKQIKHDFPRLKFINNHTGSKFSASYEDMKNLIEVLRKYDIDFLDSRTTPETQAPQIYSKMKRPLLSRGIFLDNNDSVNEVFNQIKKAIEKAKKDGYVIAICHPHKNTFKALNIAKQTLLTKVDLVYVIDIQKMISNEK